MKRALIALGLAACGGDDVPAGIDAAVGTCTPASPTHAGFVVMGEPATFGPSGSQAGGAYQSGPEPRLATTAAEAGGCRYVTARPALCEPACAGSDVCDVDGHCVRFPDNLAAGTLSITGTNPPLTLSPQPGNSYYPDTSYPGFYRAGDTIGLALAGASGIAPLTATVVGVPTIALPTDQLTATEHQDLAVAWTPIPTPAGARVIVHFDNDHHGTRSYLECEADAATGTLTIPAAILDRLILDGETGIGTYIENAWIAVRNRTLVPTERGCAAVDALSDQFVFVKTVRAARGLPLVGGR